MKNSMDQLNRLGVCHGKHGEMAFASFLRKPTSICWALTILTIVLYGVLFPSQVSAAILRVDGNPANDPDFTTVYEALDAAEEGDTLYIAGSDTTYLAPVGSRRNIVDKRLNLIGPGFFFSETFPSSRLVRRTAVVAALLLNPGSESSVVMGLELPSVDINASSVVVQRNFISGGVMVNRDVRDVSIRQNIMNFGLSIGGTIGGAPAAPAFSVTVANNYIRSSNRSGFPFLIRSGSTGFISQNVIEHTGDLPMSVGNEGFVWRNNIVLVESGELVQVDPVLSQKDLLVFTALEAAAEARPEDVFVLGNHPDGRWRLSPTSPALGAGLNGEDLGMYGGLDPYVTSGLPPIPIITDLKAPFNVTSRNGLVVELKARTVE